jgi:hypothetical protein
VTVSATPNGYADAVAFTSNRTVEKNVQEDNVGTKTVEKDGKECKVENKNDVENKSGEDVKFLMPHEEEMSMNRFLDIIEDPTTSQGIHYIQKQARNYYLKLKYSAVIIRSLNKSI